MRDIVVLAGSTPWSVLSLCKVGCRYGVKTYVVCVDSSYAQIYRKSRYVMWAENIESKHLEVFWASFFLAHSFETKPLLYFTTDTSCLLIDQNRSFYESRFELCLPSSYIISSFVNKKTAGIEATKYGLEIPKTIEITDEKEVSRVTSEFSFPVILKPVDSTPENSIGFKMKICLINDFEITANKLLAKGNSFICQEYISGKDSDCKYYIFYRDKKGTFQFCCGEKTLQGNGIMVVGTVKRDKRLSDICNKFINDIDYQGIGGIEFKFNNGHYYFIEMSVRPEGFLPISDMAGVSLADISFRSLNGCDISAEIQKEDRIYVVVLSWLLVRLKSKQYVELVKEIVGFLFNRHTYSVGFYLDIFFMLKEYRRMMLNKLAHIFS